MRFRDRRALRLWGALALGVALASSLTGCSCGGQPPTPTDGGGGGGGGVGGGGGGGGGGGTGGDAGDDGGDAGGGGDGGSDAGGGTGGGSGGGSGADGGGCGLVTCASAGAECGPIGDGCGGLIDCGLCVPPSTCGFGGQWSKCGGDAGCVPRSCDVIGANCGPVDDGCGGLVNCGACEEPETCGGGGIANRCGKLGTLPSADGGCTPQTCVGAGAECGVIGDGCGGLVTCPACTGGKACGAGGIPNVCGGGYSCVRLTECPPGACGKMSDGCDGLVTCATQCQAPEVCGGGGVPNRCGGGTRCVPKTLAELLPDGGCGLLSDGCGATLDAGVGTCPPPQACGAGGVANQCGGAATCVGRTCDTLGDGGCGAIGDGCGRSVQCGGCPAGLTCGGGGVPNRCGKPPDCVPKSCLDLGKNCGPVNDGCGTIIQCGTCSGLDICGGAGIPSVCGSVRPDGGAACTNLCPHQVSCPTGRTTLTGTVLAPTNAALGYGQPDPIPGALVYVPNDTVLPFDAGVSCDRCTDGVSGKPLVSTYSAVDGTFTLENIPCGVDIPVVIQLGRWRRQITVTSPQCCASTALSREQTRLPRWQGEGHPNDNIPRIALVTGYVDVIECVLPKIGIDAREYGTPSQNRRVSFYHDPAGNGGAQVTGTAPDWTTLLNSPSELAKYDMVIIDCVGNEYPKTQQQRLNLEAYTAAGGRVFLSHFGYVWLYGKANSGGNTVTHNISFTGTANWTPRQNPKDSIQNAFIDVSPGFPKGRTFADWVHLVGAQAADSTPAVPKIRIVETRGDMSSVIAPAQRWVFGSGDTASGVACQPARCRSNSGSSDSTPLDFSCGNGIPNGCTTGTLNCGTCSGSNTCGGGGVAGQCGTGTACVPKRCSDYGFECGTFPDGCGGVMTCGTCPSGSYCGDQKKTGKCTARTPMVPFQYTFNTPVTAPEAQQCGRVLFSDFHVIDASVTSSTMWPAQCGTAKPMTPQEKVFEYLIFDLSSCIQPDVPPPQSCTKLTCEGQKLDCGEHADGCGGTMNCGPCVAPATCGGSGSYGRCGVPCSPRSCAEQGFNCGPQGDGCGGLWPSCGECVPPQTCGGGGVPGVCGGAACTPRSCGDLKLDCGLQSDGCGGVVDCGPCPTGKTCGGSGVPGRCGAATCAPKDCATLGFECGTQTDGCGGLQDCGACVAPQVCGGAGDPGRCGGGGTCAPTTCTALGVECGVHGDGCEASIDCGPCPAGLVCGAGGVGRCAALSCQRRTCQDQGLACGPAGDGCGGVVYCGNCPPGQSCGGGGVHGQCGAPPCTPRTCESAGANCGALADGCGATLQCGTCSGGLTCGGGGIPNVCGGLQ